MELLKQRILKDGKCLPGGVLKVDSFINQQIDTNLMMEIAKEFARRFADCNVNKIITIEASGIPAATFLGYVMQIPVVFIKKKKPLTMDNMIVSTVYSFTKDKEYTVCISSDYLTDKDHILFIDDFLANGNASLGMLDLARQTGATIEGMGFIIQKAFQNGGNVLREHGIRFESLAVVKSLDNCKIELE